MSNMSEVARIAEQLMAAATASIAIPVDPSSGVREGDPLVELLDGEVSMYQLVAVEEIRGPIVRREFLGRNTAAPYLRSLLRRWATEEESAPTVCAGDARAVGRFNPAGPLGYRAASMPEAPLRNTRAEAMQDERTWLSEVYA